MQPKTLGPFTGRQLTTIIVTVVLAAVLLPGTVWAVQNFSNVAIYDPSHDMVAKVDANRSLSVAGAVTSKEAAYSTWMRGRNLVTSTGCRALAIPPSGKALIVKTVVLNAFDLTNSAGDFLELSVGTGCSASVGYYDFREKGTTTINFDPGLAVPGGLTLWTKTGAAGFRYDAQWFGYTVPASSVPSAPASQSAPVRGR